jgi:hypothetical protein
VVKTLKFMGLATGLVFVVIAFSGVKPVIYPCNLTGVLGGTPTCDGNIQWGGMIPIEP